MSRTRFVALVVVGACVTSFPPPKGQLPTAPDQNDPAFVIQGLRNWYLVGDNVTPGDDEMTVIVTAPGGSQYVDAYVGDGKPVRMSHQDNGFAMDISLADLA